MGLRLQAFVIFFCAQIAASMADINIADYAALISLTKDWENQPLSWKNPDPCESWDGVGCTNSRITSIRWSSMQLKGQLSGDLLSLSELQTLDLSQNQGLTGSLPRDFGKLTKLSNLILVGCGFSGTIPESIGSLQQLVFLSLNSNNFTGPIPPSIGNLSKLYWLDLANNQLTGTIPVSNGSGTGLDMLVHTKHFHFGMNRLSGAIPPSIFSSEMILIHVLFDNNQFTGSIPSTLGLVRTLEVVRLDRNSLSGTVPSNVNNLTSLHDLYLSNNKLTGPLPDLTGMDNLNYVDMSNNTFDAPDIPPWFSTLKSLTTLVMEHTRLQGEIPVNLFSLEQLQTVILKNNLLAGTLNIGSNHSTQLELIDLQKNKISDFIPEESYNFTLILYQNPYCQKNVAKGTYCTTEQLPAASYSTAAANCVPAKCRSGKISSPNCNCAYPYTGTLVFRAPYFSDRGNAGRYISLQNSLMKTFQGLSLPVDSVSLSNVNKDEYGYLNMLLEIFPLGEDRLNKTGISVVGFLLSNQTYKPPTEFGPYVFLADDYLGFQDTGQTKSISVGIIVGVAVGCAVLVMLLVFAGAYACYQKRRAEKTKQQFQPFASWGPSNVSGGVPQLKGARSFSYEELKKCTNNFSESNCIGSGGYGKVYRGVLTGQLIAIKRSQAGSMQGSNEFKNEIELLSRVHHKNLVNLVGFCFDQGEQTLVYEFMPNGTLLDSLSGKSGIWLDWMRRLTVALGSARGLAYLHELADPPIIHRDIKSNNILLDERLNAKVADFGLSKPFDDDDKSYITTQVKGTLGYLDPEYYSTQQLTEKSDVFSFGVVMLELITARMPIEKGKYIVREMRTVIDTTRDLYGLHGFIDPKLAEVTIKLVGFEKFVDVAMKCVQDTGAERPKMSEVVKELESILALAGVNLNAESSLNSASHEGENTGRARHLYSEESLFQYSGSIPPSQVEPK